MAGIRVPCHPSVTTCIDMEEWGAGVGDKQMLVIRAEAQTVRISDTPQDTDRA